MITSDQSMELFSEFQTKKTGLHVSGIYLEDGNETQTLSLSETKKFGSRQPPDVMTQTLRWVGGGCLQEPPSPSGAVHTTCAHVDEGCDLINGIHKRTKSKTAFF